MVLIQYEYPIEDLQNVSVGNIPFTRNFLYTRLKESHYECE